MVPIHDSDIAAERWSKAEWEHYELWEKIEVRLKRRRILWIGATAVVFLLLSSVPILMSHWPKWVSLKAVRKLGQEINETKRLAGMGNEAFRLEFSDNRKLVYSIVKVPNCATPSTAGTVVSSGELLHGADLDKYTLLSPDQGKELGIPGLLTSFCYDPLAGSSSTPSDQMISGFGVISVKDLSEKKQDRLSLLIFRGPSGEVSFE